MITRVLVANRGEIARRVFATCRRLGIGCVAVHSDADAGLPFVAEADVAVRLEGNAPADTYLRGDLVIEAAKRSGADAIHPGYGFLSENADFARAVEAAGLIWIGPSPESIEAMGSKIEAKRLMKAAGVPVLEAADGELPVLIKASAGGGGRGMRVVRRAEDLAPERAAAEAEAASAFGDGTVFLEPYVERSRHVEVQVVGNGRGDVLVLGERDCSVQRRHQKVVEEAPAAAVPGDVVDALHEAARQAAAAIDYRGAGTVEFLHDPDTQRFFFLEMNTRLQVEHPVTELVWGVDLVELQIAVAEAWASGAALGFSRGDGQPQRHAIEVRLYAEDADYTPQSGRLLTLEIDHDVAFGVGAGGERGVRVDSGFASGTEVGTHYDAMLAKVIAWAPSREQAIRQLVAALRGARIHGVVTNRDHLVDILRSPEFVADEVTTSWLESASLGPESAADSGPSGRVEVVAGALMLAADHAARRTVQGGVPAAWRNVTSQPQRTTFEGHEPVEWWGTRDGFVVDGVTVLEVSPTHARLEVDGVVTQTRGQWSDTAPGTPRELWVDGPALSACLREVPRFTDPADAVATGSLLAPMPGTVVRVAVAASDEVEAGAVVLVLEAMKMQHTVTAPHAGTVTEINVEPGAQVASGEVLAVVTEGES
ncbi:acetyl/propionyl/methylcrotonyl-CoA carboxylase subunit alpha [Nocardioides currus]|uniref:Acetyl/propionyl-CoA carboxylase subunit alpha n=1 Tax=Nocardioides currus TaxID=2133958 RepID=A0A2R7YZK8_9ACTN|nr:biotin carboxylase N-terminal domain-containing protein [Nocardioides currus]PUA81339.1 acetyl/propionyl-CoA carboxylase subunit alpha [Nocardioides currus]